MATPTSTIYYGQKLYYNGSLVQSGGGSYYPVLGLNSRLYDNGFKYNGNSGFIKKVTTYAGNTTVLLNASSNSILADVYGYNPSNPSYNQDCRSYYILISAKATSGTPYVEVNFYGYYDNCDTYRSVNKSPTFTTTPESMMIKDSFSNQYHYWDMTVRVRNGSLTIYRIGIYTYTGSNQTGTYIEIANQGSEYVAPSSCIHYV